MTDGSEALFAPAAERNKGPIGDVLQRILPPAGLVLEIASGTGQHALHMVRVMPQLRWQPSDPDPALCASAAVYAAQVTEGRILPPLCFRAEETPWPVGAVDAVCCINMIHIAPFTACEGLLRGAGALLGRGGLLYLYGPFAVDGVLAPSNADFDAMLRSEDARWGVRDVGVVESIAVGHGLEPVERILMPANNLSVILRKR